MKSTTQIHHQTSKCLFHSENWPHCSRGTNKMWEEDVSETMVSRGPLPAMCSFCSMFGLWWWMGDWGRVLTLPWCLIPASWSCSTIVMHSNTSGEWWMAVTSATCSTSFHPYLSYKETQTRQNRYCDSNPSIAQILFFVYIQLALTFCFSSSILWCLCLHDIFLSSRDLSWKMLFVSAQIIQEVGKGTRDRREGARRVECKEIFFFQDQPAYKSNPITSPWLCGIVGLNWVRRRRASSRAHIVGW